MKSAAQKNNAKGLILNGLLALLSYVTPKNRHQILIGSMRGQNFRGNPKYLYLYLLSTNDHPFSSISWITNNKKIYKELSNQSLPVVSLYSLQGFTAILRSTLLITSHNIQDVSYFQYLPGRFKKVQTYHGLPLKGPIPGIEKRAPYPLGFYLFRKERLSNRLFVTTSATTAHIERDFYYKNRVPCGYPRNDIFFDRRKKYTNYYAKFGLSKYKRKLLYCPTFRDIDTGQSAFQYEDLIALNDQLAAQNHILLVTSHHLSEQYIDYDNLSNIRNIDNEFEDIQDLLVDIDVLISDYSSISMDFILSKKPVIYYPYDYEEYTRDRGFSIDYFNDLPGPFPDNPQALANCIAGVDEWSVEKDYQARYKQLLDRFHQHQDSNSSQRLTTQLALL